MKPILFLAMAVMIMSSVNGQSTDTSAAATNLKKSAEKMGSLFLEKKYEDYVGYIHPTLIKMSGGKEKMIEGTKKSIADLETQGFTINKIGIKDPSEIIKTTTEYQSVVPQELELKTNGGRVVSLSYLIGVSSDKGKTWHFIDAGGKTLEQLRQRFATLSDKLVIPEKTKPVFYKD